MILFLQQNIYVFVVVTLFQEKDLNLYPSKRNFKKIPHLTGECTISKVNHVKLAGMHGGVKVGNIKWKRMRC